MMKTDSYEKYLKSQALRQWKLMYIKGIGKTAALQLMGLEESEFPYSTCFACEWASEKTEKNVGFCHNCPVKWSKKKENLCTNSDSPFDHWKNTSHSSPAEKACAYEVHQTILNTWIVEE